MRCAVSGSATQARAASLSPASAVSHCVLPWGLPLGAFSLGVDPASRLFLLPVYILGAAAAVSGALTLTGHDACRDRLGALIDWHQEATDGHR